MRPALCLGGQVVRTMKCLFFALPLLALWVMPAGGHFNLFISKKEVRRLLGLDNELFYVRDGVVNSYAMSFTVPVSADVLDLEFAWQSLSRHPLYYAFHIGHEDEEAMDTPKLNISLRGKLPDLVETFQLTLPCTGRKSAEVEVLMQVNVTSYLRRHNETTLNFRRNKICLYDARRVAEAEAQKEREREKEREKEKEAGVRFSPGDATLQAPMAALYAAGGGAGALLLLLAAGLAAAACRRRIGDKKRPQECAYTSYASAYGSPPSVLVSKMTAASPGVLRLGSVDSDSDCGSYATIASLKRSIPSVGGGRCYTGSIGGRIGTGGSGASPYATSLVAATSRVHSSAATESAYSSYSSYCPRRVAYYAASSVNSFGKPQVSPQVDGRLRDPSARVRLLSVPRTNIITHTLLQEGTFARLYRGVLRPIGIRTGSMGPPEEVLLKTVSDQASQLQASVLVTEGLMLAGLRHDHILAPAAVNVDLELAPIIAYPSGNLGNLKRFLLSSRGGAGGGTGEEGHFAILTKDMVHMALQVALGVAFLHTHRIWHKDIATRNCVVDAELRVKVADTALSRDLFPNDYHCLGDSENRPIGWLSPEALRMRQFGAASDVWAWGVLLWELVTFAGQPYQEVDPFELADFLRDGYRLAQPDSCPDELFGLMAICWLTAPEERPTMTQVLVALHDFSATLGHYI